MKFVKEITECRVCESKNLQSLFSLGKQALTGVFLEPQDEDPIEVELELIICGDCKFLQLKSTVDADLMYSKYYYKSGTNQTMRDHLAGVVKDVESHVDLKAGDICVDIGCNDGTLLKAYTTPGLVKVGVDPNDIITEISDPDVHKVNTYFSAKAVKEAIGDKKAKVITSISMFYDIDKPHGFVDDIVNVLDEDGVWVVEMNYTGEMIDSLGYDMISHEHVSYYTLNTFEKLVKPHGLFIYDVSFNEINSGSIRLFMGKSADKASTAVTEVKEREIAAGYEDIERYAKYAADIEEYREKFGKLIKGLHADGKTICIYGASTRGNTILQHCDLTSKEIFAAADRNSKKWGLEISGSRIKIISEEEARKQQPDYFLILPYSFLPEFVEREQDYFKAGGKFIVPLPTLKILSYKDGEMVEEVL